MIRSTPGSMSPKIQITSPRSTIDLTISTSRKLPSIRDKTSPNSGKKFFNSASNGSPAENSEKFQTKNINYFDVKPPLDERKLILVKSALEKKNNIPAKEIEPKQKFSDSVSAKEVEKATIKFDIESQKSLSTDKSISPLFNEASKQIHTEIEKTLNFITDITLEGSSTLCKSPIENILSSPDISSNEYYTEVINSLKNELNITKKKIKMQNQRQTDLRILYEEDINKLTKENYMLEKSLENAHEKIKSFKVLSPSPSAEIEGIKQKSQEKIFNAESKIADLTTELNEKSQEMTQLQEQLKKSEQNRKKFLESIKDMESEISLLNRKYSRLEKFYEDLKLENASILHQVSVEKRKNNDKRATLQ